MRNSLLAAFVVAVGLIGAGCAKDHDGKRASLKDACDMCSGVQTATADGKCPSCKMSVKDMKRTSMRDDCDQCPGVQTATADGTCPACPPM